MSVSLAARDSFSATDISESTMVSMAAGAGVVEGKEEEEVEASTVRRATSLKRMAWRAHVKPVLPDVSTGTLKSEGTPHLDDLDNNTAFYRFWLRVQHRRRLIEMSRMPTVEQMAPLLLLEESSASKAILSLPPGISSILAPQSYIRNPKRLSL